MLSKFDSYTIGTEIAGSKSECKDVSTLYVSLIGGVFGFIFGMLIAGIFAITSKLKVGNDNAEPGTPCD